MLVIKPVLIFHIIDHEFNKKLITYGSSTLFWQIFFQTRQLLFSALQKISYYGWFDWTRWVLIASNKMAQRELQFLKRRVAKGTTLVSLACEDVHLFVCLSFCVQNVGNFMF